jgi:hypothetical protein
MYARDDYLAIVLGTRQHPIQYDYAEWMFESNRSETHASPFLTNFRTNFVPGDTLVIEPQAAFVIQSVPRDITATAEAPVAMSTTSHLRATMLTEWRFNLFILRAYLNRSSAADTQVYFLAQKYSVKEFQNTPSDAPFLVARTGKVICYLTVLERALRGAEGAGNEQIPLMWCRIGTLQDFLLRVDTIPTSKGPIPKHGPQRKSHSIE